MTTESAARLPLPPASPSAGYRYPFFPYSSGGSFPVHPPQHYRHHSDLGAHTSQSARDYFSRPASSGASAALKEDGQSPPFLTPITPSVAGSVMSPLSGTNSPPSINALGLVSHTNGLKRPRSERPEDEDSFDDSEQPARDAPTPSLEAEAAAALTARRSEEKDDEKGGNGRTLKQTKRVARNRAAQQAFRKRKEERIKELEEKEKLLASYDAREKEHARRETQLREREHRLSMLEHQAALTSRSHEAHHLPPLPLLQGDIRVSSKESEIISRLESEIGQLRVENDSLSGKLVNREALCESLRSALEDMAEQNRRLRDPTVQSRSPISDTRGFEPIA